MACEAPCDFGCVIWELYLFNCVDMDTCRSPVMQCSNFSYRTGALGLLDSDHADVGHREQASIQHCFEDGHQSIDIFRSVHDLHNDRQIVPQNVRAMDLGSLTVAFQAAKDGRARDLQLTALFNHGCMQRFALITIPLGEVQPEKLTWGCRHRLSPREAASESGARSRRRTLRSSRPPACSPPLRRQLSASLPTPPPKS